MAKAYVKHDYAVTGRDYVETDGGDTPGGGIDYSTEEQDTGLTWVDGSKIYQKTFEYTITDTATLKTPTIEANTQIKDIILGEYRFVWANGLTNATLPYTSGTDSSHIVASAVHTGTNLNLNYMLDIARSNCKIVFTLRYTKTE